MRAYEFLNETIVNRPRKLKHYLETRIKQLSELENQLAIGQELVKNNERVGSDLVSQFIRIGSDYSISPSVGNVEYFVRQFERFFPIIEVKKSLEDYLRHGPSFIQYIIGKFEYTQPFHDDYREIFDGLKFVKDGAKGYGFNDNDDDPEYLAALELCKGLVIVKGVIEKASPILKEIKEKISAVIRVKQFELDPHKYRPEHDEVETLYHATAFASEIVRDGFKAEKPQGRRGLGNYGEQNGISFTHDYKIAQDLCRALREVWMIQHGQLSAKTILGWFKAEKIDQKYENIAGTVGIGVEEPNEDSRFQSRYRLKQLHELKSKEETAKLYKVYLALSEIRTDPMFTYIEETLELMKDRDIKDIGILACVVKLEEKDEYLFGESEFRLPPNRVQSIKRII
jgi:hypothetical protein